MRKRNVGEAAVALAASVRQRRTRSRQREVGWPTDEEELLYAERRSGRASDAPRV